MELLDKIGQLNNTSTSKPGVILEKIMTNTKDMLIDRGLTIVSICKSTGEALKKMEENQPVIQSVNNSSNESLHVFFHNEERVGVKQLRLWNEEFNGESILIVSLEGPTAFTRKEADNLYKSTQFFLFRDLCVNITKHCLVPKHEKMSVQAMKQMPYRSSHNFNEYPKLYTTDKIALYYNYKPGDMIKITRIFGYQEPIYYYRLVVDPPNC